MPDLKHSLVALPEDDQGAGDYSRREEDDFGAQPTEDGAQKVLAWIFVHERVLPLPLPLLLRAHPAPLILIRG